MGGAGALRGAQRAHKSRESEYSEVSLRVLHFDSWRGARTLIADGLATSPTSASSGRSAPGLEGLEGLEELEELEGLKEREEQLRSWRS